MSSENEMINQPGDNEPELETAPQQPETAIEPVPEPVEEVSDIVETAVEADDSSATAESPVETESEPSAEEDEDPDDGWEAWIEANPEEEEIFETPAEAVAEPEPVSEHEGEPVTEEAEVPANAVDEPEPTSEVDEEPAEDEPVENTPPVEDETAQAEAVEERPEPSEEPVAEPPAPPPPKPQKEKKRRRDGLTTEHVITYFAPCGRCGYFLSGYRAIYGRDDLETAVSEAKSGWLSLNWGLEMQDLVLKSYGSRIETNDLLFDGCCSECRRVFVYKTSRSENKPATFRIEIKPRKRQ